ncbi:carboxymuconolactone decarboxylase family protein [Rhodococcus sp. NPDC059968]|uniref:carboxymuconolactone decarboxylase family protein n=1 Tax=Rhodococcus sp. NPDC059968 TaxID=3347017 RepID=UPI00366BF85B
MARIAPAPPEVYVPLMGEDVPLVMRVHARRPERAVALVSFFGAWMAETVTLPPRLVEMVRLRIAFYNQCRSCMAMRYESALADGLDEDLVCSLEKPEEAENLSPAERAALRFAELMATNHLAIDDAFYDDLRLHFSEEEIVELGQIAAFCVGFGRLDATWDLRDDLPDHFKDQGPASGGVVATPWGGTEWVKVGAMG